MARNLKNESNAQQLEKARISLLLEINAELLRESIESISTNKEKGEEKPVDASKEASKTKSVHLFTVFNAFTNPSAVL